jgi:microcompartment protein CcmK/EutM
MQLGRVIGTVVASQKQAKIDGFKLLIVQNTDNHGKLLKDTVVAADSVGAGLGELVIYTSGSSSRYTPHSFEAPIDHMVVGIVDAIHLHDKCTYDKLAEEK